MKRKTIERLIGKTGILRSIRIEERKLKRRWRNILGIIPNLWVSSAIDFFLLRMTFSRIWWNMWWIAWYLLSLLLGTLLVLRTLPLLFPLYALFLWTLFAILFYFALTIFTIAHLSHQVYDFFDLIIYFSFRWLIFSRYFYDLFFNILGCFL